MHIHILLQVEITVKFRKKGQGLYYSKALVEGPIFLGAYLRREVCVSKLARLLLGGKSASQNRLG